MKINLSELLEKIEFSSEDLKYYWSKDNGEFILHDEQEYGYLEDLDIEDMDYHPEWDRDVIEMLIDIRENTDNYLEVPYCEISRGLSDREKEIEYLKVAINWCEENNLLPVN